jgi:hypothetical protein
MAEVERRMPPAIELGEDSLLNTIRGLSRKIPNGNTSHWHFSITAPRWAMRSPKSETIASAAAGVVALGLATGGALLAWDAINRLTASAAGLAAQIGAWVVVAVLLAGAGAAATAAFGSRRLHLRITQLSGGDDAARALAASTSAPGPHAGETASTATPSPAAGAAARAAPAGAAVAAGDAAANSAGSGPADGSPSALTAATTVSPKLWAGSIAGAIAFSFWTIAAATFWKNTFSSDALAALVGSTTAIVAAAAAYLKADPLRSRH